ncbi:MAG: tetratricopeptide repeat protein [Melioribacteraceae bacterium]
MRAKKLFALASFFSFLIALSGCGIWTDFTTYFNTYYNAKTLFDQVEEEIILQKKDIFIFREDLQTGGLLGGQNISQFNQPANSQFGNQTNQQTNNQFGSQFNQQNQNPQTASQQGTVRSGAQLSGSLNENLKRVIEKCSKILQYEKNSSYFADALFITGKALYYQQEYARAQRKFTELAGLGETKYSSENKLWLAKTNLQLRNFDEGLKLLEEVKREAISDSDDKLLNDASITKISFLIFRQDLRAAIEECKNYLKESDDDEISALVSFQMGKIYLNLDDEQSALDAFSGVTKYEPTVDVEFQSRFESAKLLKNLDRLGESEEAFDELRYMGKFKNYTDQVMIELGQIYYEKNNITQAVDIFREVDTMYRPYPTSGIAEMKLAEIFHKKLGLYDSALVYYTKASISMTTKEVRSESGYRAADFNKYFTFKDEKKYLERDLDYLSDINNYMRDSIDYAIAYREYLDNVKAVHEAQKTEQNMMNVVEINFAVQEQQYKQQLLAMLQKPQKGLILTPAQLIGLGRYKKPDRPRFSADSTKTILSKSLYNLASLFYSELDVPDSARFYFSKILKEYPNTPVRTQTMYALGTYYETHNDSVKADSLFRSIYDNFEKDPMRPAAAQKLGLVKKEEKIVIVKKEEDPAEPLYYAAEQIYFNKKFEEAIDSFKTVYRRFPESGYAPKSLYYTGMIYEKDLKMYDSAASAYKILTNDFSKSKLAALILPRYTEYKNEKERIFKEEEAKRLEIEKQQKEIDLKNSEKNLQQTEKTVPAVSEKNIDTKKENLKDKKPIKNGAVKDSVLLKDSLRVREEDSSQDSNKVKTDTTRVKPEKIPF